MNNVKLGGASRGPERCAKHRRCYEEYLLNAIDGDLDTTFGEKMQANGRGWAAGSGSERRRECKSVSTVMHRWELESETGDATAAASGVPRPPPATFCHGDGSWHFLGSWMKTGLRLSVFPRARPRVTNSLKSLLDHEKVAVAATDDGRASWWTGRSSNTGRGGRNGTTRLGSCGGPDLPMRSKDATRDPPRIGRPRLRGSRCNCLALAGKSSSADQAGAAACAEPAICCPCRPLFLS